MNFLYSIGTLNTTDNVFFFKLQWLEQGNLINHHPDSFPSTFFVHPIMPCLYHTQVLALEIIKCESKQYPVQLYSLS